MIRNFGFLISLLKQLIPTSKNFLLPMPAAVKNFYHNNSFSISFSHTHPAPSYQDVCISTHCDTMRSIPFFSFTMAVIILFNLLLLLKKRVKSEKARTQKWEVIQKPSYSSTKLVSLRSAGTFRFAGSTRQNVKRPFCFKINTYQKDQSEPTRWGGMRTLVRNICQSRSQGLL